MIDGKGIHVRYVPGTYRPLANKDNDYLMDRDAQRAGTTYSGVEGIAMQDASLQESMGTDLRPHQGEPRLHRQRHHHGPPPPDEGGALAEKGVTPPGVDPEHQRVRSAAVVLPPDQPYKEAAKEALRVRPGVAQASV